MPCGTTAQKMCIRDRLESVLGYRQQPVRDGAGTLAEAKVLSIDSESGVVVLNLSLIHICRPR